MVALDIGGSFGAPPPGTPAENNVFLTEVMKRAEYLCANAGLAEAKFGVEYLRDRARETGVPYLSANLVRPGGTKPLLPPYLVTQAGGLRIGILGLLDGPEVPPRELAEHALEIRDPIEAAAELVPKLRKKCDYVVVAGYMLGPRATELASRVPGIDLVLFRGLREQSAARQVGSTVFAPAGSRSGQISELDLQFAGTPRAESFLGDILRLKETGPRDEDLRRQIDELVDRQAKERILASQKPAPPAVPAAATAPPPAPAGEEAASPPHDASHAMAAAGNAWVNPWSTAAPTDFVGAPVCHRCHTEVHAAWEADPHAQAFATLAATESWNAPECLACHTTGYGVVTGSQQGLPAPEFWNVQCEACHGPGGRHVTNPAVPLPPVTAGTCLSCHTPQWSPGFDAVSAMKGAARGH